MEVLATATREETDIKGTQIGKVVVKLSLFADDMILHKENPTDATRKLPGLIDEFGGVPKDTKLVHLAFPSTNQHKIREIKETIPFGIAIKRIKCLEINLPKNAKDLRKLQNANERNQTHGCKHMERYTMFLDWKN